MLETAGRLAEFDWREQERAPKGTEGGGRWVAEGTPTTGEVFAAPVHNFKAKSGPATAAEVNALRSHLHSLTTAQLKRLAAEHDVPHAGRDKVHLVSELHKKIVAHREGAKPVVYTEGKDAGLQAFQATPEEKAKMQADDWRKRVPKSQGGFLPDKTETAPANDKADREDFRKVAVRLLDSIGHRHEARRLEAGFIPRKLHPSTAQHLVGVAERFGVTLPPHVYEVAKTKTTTPYTHDFHEAEFAEVALV